jgi:hypothetical protein
MGVDAAAGAAAVVVAVAVVAAAAAAAKPTKAPTQAGAPALGRGMGVHCLETSSKGGARAVLDFFGIPLNPLKAAGGGYLGALVRTGTGHMRGREARGPARRLDARAAPLLPLPPLLASPITDHRIPAAGKKTKSAWDSVTHCTGTEAWGLGFLVGLAWVGLYCCSCA